MRKNRRIVVLAAFVIMMAALFVSNTGVGAAEGIGGALPGSEPPRVAGGDVDIPGMPSKEELDQYQNDGTLEARLAFWKSLGSYKIDPNLIEGVKKRGNAAFPSGWRLMPAQGAAKALVFLVEFTDKTHDASVTREKVSDSFFKLSTDPNVNSNSVRQYYKASSYGKLDITGDVYGWYKVNHPRDYYSDGYAGRERLLGDVISHYNSQGVDFTKYDGNNDGVIDCAYIVFAGTSTGWGSQWYSYCTNWTDEDYRVDSKGLNKYIFLADPRVNAIVHETGHALGLPDYYDYDGVQVSSCPQSGEPSGVGGDMMECNIGDHNAFSKLLLGWATPIVVDSGSRTVSLPPLTTNGQVLLVAKDWNGDLFSEYYLVELWNKNKLNIEYTLFTDYRSGVKVWHVNASLNDEETDFENDNSTSPRKLLRLMEADGKEDIPGTIYLGGVIAEYEELYHEGQVFGPDTFPTSDYYGGVYSGVKIKVNSEGFSGASLTVSIEDADSVAPSVTGSTFERDSGLLSAVDGSVYFSSNIYEGSEFGGITIGKTGTDETIALDAKINTYVYGYAPDRDVSNNLRLYSFDALESGCEYTLTIPQGAVTDASGNPNEAYTLQFRASAIPERQALDMPYPEGYESGYLRSDVFPPKLIKLSTGETAYLQVLNGSTPETNGEEYINYILFDANQTITVNRVIELNSIAFLLTADLLSGDKIAIMYAQSLGNMGTPKYACIDKAGETLFDVSLPAGIWPVTNYLMTIPRGATFDLLGVKNGSSTINNIVVYTANIATGAWTLKKEFVNLNYNYPLLDRNIRRSDGSLYYFRTGHVLKSNYTIETGYPVYAPYRASDWVEAVPGPNNTVTFFEMNTQGHGSRMSLYATVCDASMKVTKRVKIKDYKAVFYGLKESLVPLGDAGYLYAIQMRTPRRVYPDSDTYFYSEVEVIRLDKDLNILWTDCFRSADRSVNSIAAGIMQAGDGWKVLMFDRNNCHFAQREDEMQLPAALSGMITLDKSAMKLALGDKEKLKATLTGDLACEGVTWTSIDGGIASVSADGTVRANNIGETIVLAVSDAGGFVAACKVTVLETVPCTVKFNSMGGTGVSSVVVNKNSTVRAPSIPTRTGYVLLGWYRESSCVNVWNFSADKVTADITLYAKWASATPANPKAVSSSYTGIAVSWSAVPAVSGYEVWRSTSSASGYTLIKTTAAASIADTGLVTGRYYYYKVRAYRLSGATRVPYVFSSVVSARPIPANPYAFKAVRASATSIRVSWGAVSGATRYEVWRCTTRTGTYSLIVSTPSLAFLDTRLRTGQTYYYRIRIYHLEGSVKVYGNWSVIVAAKP